MSPLDIASQGKLEANHRADDRVDVLDPAVTKRRLRQTQSVGMIVHLSSLIPSGDAWLLRAEKKFAKLFDASIPLCPDERFRDEPVVESEPPGKPFASCCLVHPKAVLSCAHGFEMDRMEEFRVVFGYRTLENGGVQLRIPPTDVHEIDRVFDSYHYKREGLTVGADWAVLLLKQPSQRPIARVAEPPPQAAQRGAVYTIGHPHGLPMKFCLNGQVNTTCIPGVFAAPLDTDDGNSGSPIFFCDKVIGVLIERQESDTPDYAQFKPEQGPTCYKRQQYSTAGGEIVCTRANGTTYTTRVVGQLCTSASAFLPALARLRAAYP
jgi:hypothetical protein